jgi:cytochrome c oxidase assembly protein subunit 15
MAFDAWRHRFAVTTVAATLALIFIGGLVTSTGSGLSVPDWPLSYGMLMPPMVGGVFYEHGHRMAATAVGFLTLVLAGWTARAESRRGIRRLAWAALAAVVAQGILGGLTVIYLLPTPVSVAHACLAQLFFCTLIAIATVTSREWLEAEGVALADPSGLRGAAAAATAAVFVQLLLGAVMRHTGAGLAIPDFPTSFGRWLPPLDSLPVAIHFAHRIGALVVLALAVRLAMVAWRAVDRRFRRPAALVVVLVLAQIALGAATVLTGKAVTPTTAHVALGAAILGSCWWITLRARRVLARPSLRAAAAVALGEPVAS